MDAEPRRCVRCVLTERFPRVSFDAEGVCSYCRAFESRWKNWNAPRPEAELVAILEKARKKNPRYPCLVGVSGGKDSCYTLHLLARKYGTPLLAFTYDNGFLHEGARRNVDRMVRELGVEHRYLGMDRELLQRRVRALLRNNCSDLCMLCMNGVAAAFHRLAAQEKIPVLAWANSPRQHSLIPLEMINFLDFRFLADALRPHVRKADLAEFRYVDLPWVLYLTYIRRVRQVFVPEYGEWDDRANAAFLTKEYGWEDYGRGVPHFDCVINPAVNYFMNVRLGASKVQEQVSQQVRCGVITREEALRKLAEEDSVEEPAESVNELCRRLDLTRDEIRPLREGTARDYRHFRGYARLFRRLAWLLWLSSQLGFTPKGLYQKYS